MRAASSFLCGGKRPPGGLPRAPEGAWAADTLSAVDPVPGWAERPADCGSELGPGLPRGARVRSQAGGRGSCQGAPPGIV